MTRRSRLGIVAAVLVFQASAVRGQERIPDLVDPPIDEFNSHVTNAQVISSLGLASGDVSSLSFSTSSHAGFDVFGTAASGYPTEGTDYFVMSSGSTGSALMANNSGSTSTVLAGLNQSQGNDLVQMTLVLTPPTGESSISFEWKFFSEEFPEFVGTQFNDAFLVELGSSTFTITGISTITAPNNVAFDGSGNPITINTTGALGMTAANAAGTTYDGATTSLVTVVPFPSGSTSITLIFSVMDLGDSIYDTTIFLDNFTWGSGTGGPATTPTNGDPDAFCQDVAVSADVNCQGNATAADVDNGSSDPDSDPITLALSPAGPYGLGPNSVVLTVEDDQGGSDTCTATVTVFDDTDPSITCPTDISSECDGADGVEVNFSVVASDNCGAPTVICIDQYGAPVASGDVFPIGSTDVTCTADDGNGNTSSCSFGVSVTSTSPSGLILTGSPLVAAVGTSVSFTATFTDNASDNHVADWDFGDGHTAQTDPAMSPVGEDHAFASQGIYTVNVTITDQCGNTATDSVVVVVFDNADGFVTGGGWIRPDDGSYTEDLGDVDGIGKANFGFIVKYKKGADNPDGSLEFRYRNGDINLHSVMDKSADFEWLVITSDKKIRFKGNGTVNGVEDVSFKVTAADNGEPGAGTDTFKIEIWTGHDFDTENGSGASGKHMIQGTLGGGNIKIH